MDFYFCLIPFMCIVLQFSYFAEISINIPPKRNIKPNAKGRPISDIVDENSDVR